MGPPPTPHSVRAAWPSSAGATGISEKLNENAPSNKNDKSSKKEKSSKNKKK